jgi:hypothetical protein
MYKLISGARPGTNSTEHTFLLGSLVPRMRPFIRKGESDLLRGGSGGGVRDGGLGEHGEHVGNSTVRDPDLPAVHDPVLPVLAQLSPRLENQ